MIDSTKNLYFNSLHNTNNTLSYHYCIIDNPHPEDQDDTLTGSSCLATSFRIDSFNLGTWIQKLLKPALYLLRVNFGLTVFTLAITFLSSLVLTHSALAFGDYSSLVVEWDTTYNWTDSVSGTSKSAHYQIISDVESKILKARVIVDGPRFVLGWVIDQYNDGILQDPARSVKLAGNDSSHVDQARVVVSPYYSCRIVSNCRDIEFHPQNLEHIRSEEIVIRITVFLVGNTLKNEAITVTMKRKNLELSWQYSSFNGEILAGIYSNPANNGYNWQYGLIKSNVPIQNLKLVSIEEPTIGPVVTSEAFVNFAQSSSIVVGSGNRFGNWTISRTTETCDHQYCYRFIFKPNRYQLNHLRRDVNMHLDLLYINNQRVLDQDRITLKLRARYHAIPEISIAVHPDSKNQTTEANNGVVKFVGTSSLNAINDLEIGVEITETGDFLPTVELRPTKFTIARGQNTGTLLVPLIDDRVDESNGMVTVRLLADQLNTITYQLAINPEYQRVSAQVVDDDIPSLAIGVHSDTQYLVREAPDLLVNFELKSDLLNFDELMVQVRLTSIGNYLDGGTSELITSVTIPANSSLGILTVPIHYNGVTGNDGAVRAEIQVENSEPPAYLLSTVQDQVSASLVILNYDPNQLLSLNRINTPIVSVAPHRESIPSISEADGFLAKFVVFSHIAVTSDLVVNLRITETSNYLPLVGSLSNHVVIVAGETAATIDIPLVNNSVDEIDGLIRIRVEPDSRLLESYRITDFEDHQIAEVRVIDDEVPEISISVHADSIVPLVESPVAVAKFTITSDLQPVQDLTIGLEVSETSDFIPIPNNTKLGFTFRANQLTEIFNLEIKDDYINDERGTATVRLTKVSSGSKFYKITTNVELQSATVNIEDNDKNRLMIKAVSEVISEGESAEFRITSSFIRTEAMRIQLRVSQIGDFLVEPTEFRNVILEIGSTEDELSLSLATEHDSIVEKNGRITVEISSVQASSLVRNNIATSSATIAVLDVDGTILPVVAIAAEQNWVRGGETVAINFTVEPIPLQDLIVQVGVRQSVQGLIRWRNRQTVVISNGKGSMLLHTNQFNGRMGAVNVFVLASDEYDVVNNQEEIEVYGVSYTASSYEQRNAVSNSVAQAILRQLQEPSIPIVERKPVVSITSLFDYVEEGEPAKIRISTQNSVAADLDVHLAISNETNEHENNFNATATILAGESEVIYEFATTDDFVPEDSYKVLITLIENHNYDIESPSQAEFMLTHENDQLREAIHLTNQLVLPELVESSTNDLTSTISKHMQLALTGELKTSFKLGGEDSIMGFVTTSGNAVNEKKLDLSSVLRDSAFVAQISPNSLFENKLSVWGVGNQQDISAILARSNQNVNGELYSRHVGTDLKLILVDWPDWEFPPRRSKLRYKELS